MAELLSDDDVFGPAPSQGAGSRSSMTPSDGALLSDDDVFGTAKSAVDTGTLVDIAATTNPLLGAVRGAQRIINRPAGGVEDYPVELGKSAIEGAKNLPASSLKGIAATTHLAPSRFTQEQIQVFDRIDRGERVPRRDDAHGYQDMAPEQRQALRTQFQGFSEEHVPPVTENPLYRAGEAIEEFGKETLGPRPGFEGRTWTRDIGGGFGSVGAGIVTSMLNPSAAMLMFVTAGQGEAADRAVKAGATPEQIELAAKFGTVAGATDVVDALLPALGGTGRALGFLKRVGYAAVAGALAEGGQEGLQQFIQNVIAQQIYKPDQDWFEDVPRSVAVGMIVGGATSGGFSAAQGRADATAGPVYSTNTPQNSTNTPDYATPGLPPGAVPAATMLPVEDQNPTIPPNGAPPENPVGWPLVSDPAPGASVVAPWPASAPLPAQPPQDMGSGAALPPVSGDSRETPPPPLVEPEPAGRLTLQKMLDDPRTAEEMRADIQRHEQEAQAAIAWRPTDEWQPVPQLVVDNSSPAPLGTGPDGRPLEWKTEGGKTFARIPPPPGTRESPVVLEGPETVHIGAEITNPTPSSAQAEAGNYAKRHLKWQGRDISIETEAGAERVGKDGSWSVTMPTPYGHILATKGADGDQVDVYVGPQPAAPQVFVLDQVDPDSRAFDEHKTFVGFESEAAALAAYEAAFSDGSASFRVGAITPMSIPQFKAWLANGNTKKAVAYTPQTTPRKVTRKGPLSLFEFLAARGGIKDHGGELRHMNLHTKFIPGYGRLVRANGRALDEAREAALEAGYLQDMGGEGASTSTVADLLDALDREARGEKVYSQADVEEVQNRTAQRAADESAERIDATKAEIRDLAKEHGVTLSEDEITKAAEHALVNGTDLIEAIVEIASRDAYAEHEDAVASESPKEPAHEQPAENVATGTGEDGARPAPPRREPARPDAAEAATPAPRVEQPAGPQQAGSGVPGSREAAAPEAVAPAAPVTRDEPEKLTSTKTVEADDKQPGQIDESVKAPKAPEAGPSDSGAEAVPRPAPTDAPQTPSSAKPEAPNTDAPAIAFARDLLKRLEKGQPITAKIMQDMASEIYGGALSTGKFDRKDMFDALELAVNLHVRDTRHLRVDSPNPLHAMKMLGDVLAGLPTQRVRSEEQDSFQQFSTPPNYSAAAAYAANLRDGDVVLEPSAGTGSLVAAASKPGVKIIANEISERRAELLKELVGKDGRVFGEDAEQLHNILPDHVKPTVVVMNPPFSRAGNRMGNAKQPMTAANHIEAALDRLEPGGRLVAIVGQGMTMGQPTYRAWWGKIGKDNTVAANIGVDGKVYEKYGTTFGTRLIVIDKNQPAPDHKPVLAEAQTVEDLMRVLEGVRDVRPQTVRSAQLDAAQSERPGASARGEGGSTAALPVSSEPGSVGPGEPGERGMAADGDAGAAAAGGRDVRVEAGKRDGVAPDQPERPGPKRAGDGSAQRVEDGAKPEAGRGDGSQRDLQSPASGQSRPAAGSERVELETHAAPGTQGATEAISESLYQSYEPARVRVKGAKPHPGPLVESASMSSVSPPAATYQPSLPKKVIENGLLSLAQLEAVVYAGQAHGKMLPAAEDAPARRRGYFIGDGTGVGKGREIAGIILDNWQQGRTKAVWVSEKKKLLNDAKRDWKGLDQNPAVIFDVGKVKTGEPVSTAKGIGFITYDTLKGGLSDQAAIARGAFIRKQAVSVNGQAGIVQRVEPQGRHQPPNIVVKLDNSTEVTVPAHEVTAAGAANVKSRVDQIVDWVGKDFDGVIAFDEAHNMGNATSEKGERGQKDAAQKALAGLELQSRLPNARVVYVSATGATEVSNLAYAERLGLWGRGTAFASQAKFVSEVAGGGIAAMELIARDMKQLGLYTARNLSYDGVEYARIEHKLDANQREIYDALAEAWQVVLRNINAALVETGGDKDGRAKAAAMSAFWGGHQRFFNQIITSLQMPSVIKAVEKDLAEGRQAVLQLTNTNEASQERAAAKAETAEQIEDLDITPRDQIIQLVEVSFPTQEYEEYVDSNGKVRARPVVDKDGNPVQNKKAVAMRDALIEKLASIRVPQGPLDMVLDHFGIDVVAEVTGRGRRFVLKADERSNARKRMEESRPASANQAETDVFQAGKKKVLVFSEAGGTGASYHADNSSPSKNARRAHYLVQGGWRADKAVQGFGRTHRTNQASAPIVSLVTTDLQGQKRFISSIARRLGQLGALTKGQRQAGDQGIFSARDNLESTEARQALQLFFRDILAGNIEGVRIDEFEAQTGLKLRNQDEEGRSSGKQEFPPITQFLNRLLSLKIDMQNRVFDAFSDRLDAVIEARRQAGLLDVGLETIKADKITKDSEQTVHTIEEVGADTKHVKFTVADKFEPIDFDKVVQRGRDKGNPLVFFARSPNNKVYAVFEAPSLMDAKAGTIIDSYRIINPVSGSRVLARKNIDQSGGKWTKIDKAEAQKLWNAETEKAPEFVTRDMHLITGAILPIWDRLKGSTRVVRLQTDAGERFIGRIVPNSHISATLKALGAEQAATKIEPDALFEKLMAGARASLANGWVLSRRLVAGEQRIELTGPSSFSEGQEVKADGAFTERINYAVRYFVPVDETDGPKVLAKITQYRPVVDLSDGKASSPTEDGDEEMFKLGAAAELRTPFTGKFLEHAEAVFPILRTELDRLGLKNVGLKLVDTIEIARDGNLYTADGMFFKGVITLALKYDNKFHILNHEALHGLRRLGVFTAGEWSILERASNAKWRKEFNIAERYGKRDEWVQVEEGIAYAWAAWADGKLTVDGRIARLFKRIRDFLEAVGNALRGEGFKTAESIFRDIKSGAIGNRDRSAKGKTFDQWAPAHAISSGDGDLFKTEIGVDGKPQTIIPGAEKITDKERAQRGANAPLKPGKAQKPANEGLFGEPDTQQELFALSQNPQTAIQRQRVMQGFLARGQFIDRAIRMPFDWFGGTSYDGQWKPGAKLFDKAAKVIVGATFSVEGRFAFLNPIMETARSGLIDRYNLRNMPEYVTRERERSLDERAVMMQGAEILKSLKDHAVGREEAKVLQAILNGEDVDNRQMAALAEPIRAAIDQLGQEAVALGLVSAESFERNRGIYLHRVYKKYEAEQHGLARMVNGIMATRRKKIIGDQFRGRGMFEEITVQRLMKDVPGWIDAGRGRPVKGEKFIVLDEIGGQQQLGLNEDASREKVLRRVYWPADRAVPDKYSGFRDQGTWEIRGEKDGKLVIWRDFTKAERVNMGEILDARYTIGKTFMLMAHDLSVGKFYKDISENEDWTSTQHPAGSVIDAAEWSAQNRSHKRKVHDWVKVPGAEIPNSGGKKRWGALAGRFVREEIWRDLNELEVMSRPGVWRALLTQWKLNRTARSPIVHMNNVVSNFVLMDMQDVRFQDLYAGIKSFANGDQHYEEAFRHGAFGADMMTQEVRDQVLKPILDELMRDNTLQQGGPLGVLGQVSKFTELLWSKLKALDQKMIDVYRVEDELFRMATYLRRRELGDDPKQAAQVAREQFIDYDIRAPWVRAARNTVLPFISYTYRAVPLVAKAVATRPWKVGKYALLAYVLNAAAYSLSGGDEDKERRSLRENEQGKTWIGAPRMMRMPWNDKEGNPVFLDIRRWMPAGDVFDFNQGQLALPLVPAWLIPGGPLMLAAELILNKQAFTGREITNDKTDDLWDKTSKVADWAWKAWAPNALWVPGSWSNQKMQDASEGVRERYTDRPINPNQAFAASFGVKLKPEDLDRNFERKGREFNRVMDALKLEQRNLAVDRDRGAISEATYNRGVNNILKKMERTATKASETLK